MLVLTVVVGVRKLLLLGSRRSESEGWARHTAIVIIGCIEHSTGTPIVVVHGVVDARDGGSSRLVLERRGLKELCSILIDGMEELHGAAINTRLEGALAGLMLHSLLLNLS